MALLSKPWAADAHDAGFGWPCRPNRGQLMLMMLASGGFAVQTKAADAHDAGFGWLCCPNCGQLMLMMLASGGFAVQTVGS